MATNVKKKSFKESWRKFIVSLKRRPHNIALVLMVITYMVYSFCLSNISHTTAVINLQPMGLCSFVVMLLSLLGMVSFLNAFPARQKPKLPMVIILYVIQVLVFAADVVYYLKIEEGVAKYPEILEKAENDFVLKAELVVIIHMILIGVCTLIIALLPVIGKLLNKINTSIQVEESANVKEIDISNE